MRDTEFYMVGLIHGEEKGKKILKGLLNSLKPDVITLEFTNFGLSFRKKNYPRLRKRVTRFLTGSSSAQGKELVARVLNFLRLPFEYVVAKEYAKKNNIPLYLVDMDFFSYYRLRYVDEILDPENLLNLLAGSRVENMEDKKAAEMYFKKGIRLFNYTPEMRVRDEYMRRLIGKIIERHNPKRLTHLCGWQHLVDQYGYFSDLDPKKIFVYDKAICL